MFPNPKGPAFGLKPMDRRDRRHLLAATLHQGIGAGNLPRKREQERHRVVGDFVHAKVGDIGDDDLALPRHGESRSKRTQHLLDRVERRKRTVSDGDDQIGD